MVEQKEETVARYGIKPTDKKCQIADKQLLGISFRDPVGNIKGAF